MEHTETNGTYDAVSSVEDTYLTGLNKYTDLICEKVMTSGDVHSMDTYKSKKEICQMVEDLATELGRKHTECQQLSTTNYRLNVDHMETQMQLRCALKDVQELDAQLNGRVMLGLGNVAQPEPTYDVLEPVEADAYEVSYDMNDIKLVRTKSGKGLYVYGNVPESIYRDREWMICGRYMESIGAWSFSYKKRRHYVLNMLCMTQDNIVREKRNIIC